MMASKTQTIYNAFRAEPPNLASHMRPDTSLSTLEALALYSLLYLYVRSNHNLNLLKIVSNKIIIEYISNNKYIINIF